MYSCHSGKELGRAHTSSTHTFQKTQMFVTCCNFLVSYVFVKYLVNLYINVLGESKLTTSSQSCHNFSVFY